MFDFNFQFLSEHSLSLILYSAFAVPFLYHWMKDKYYPLEFIARMLKIYKEAKKCKEIPSNVTKENPKFSSKNFRNDDLILNELMKISKKLKAKK